MMARHRPHCVRSSKLPPVVVAAILWEFSEGGSELCVLDRKDRGWELSGTAVLAAEQEPAETRDSVLVGPTWATGDVEVVVSFPNGDIREPIELGALWSGKERPPEFRDCVDVDLGFTPATNTLPIRRLGLEVGEAAGLAVAWLNGPRSVSNVPSSATSAWPVTATATRPATSRRT
jgi:uncharacterized protein